MNVAPVLGPSGETLSPVEYAQIRPILERRCLPCHSRANTDELYKTAPNGILFDTESQLAERWDKVRFHVVVAKSMPLANRTSMTDDERTMFARWLSGLKH